MKLKEPIKFQDILAVLTILICAGYFFWVSQPNMATNENHNVGEIKTAFIAAFMLVLNYYMGSSKSSSEKNATIASMQENISNQPIVNTDVVKTETANVENVETINTNSTTLAN